SSCYVYSALIVTDNVTINLSNSASINVCAIIGYKQPSTTIVAQRGVMMNNGTINVASGCTVNAYGFIKCSGKLNLANGSTAIDCIRTYDFPGGTAGRNMYKDVFPANAWTAHNISCETKIMSGAIYKSILNVKVVIRIDATATIIGTSGSCFFKPTAINDNTYLIKTTTDLPNATNLSTIGGSNQIAGQKELFELYGSWEDSSFSISVSVITFETSEEKPAPMGFVDVTLKSGSSLTISNSSYMFMPGTKLIIEENATLTCNKRLIFLRYSDLPDATSYANYRFITYCKDTDDAEADVYGTMVINGSVGGRINPMSTTARLNISGAVESTYRSMSATDSPYYKEDSVPAVFGDEDTPTPLESLVYEGVVDSALGFAWSSVSGLPTYTIIRDLNDGSSTPSSQLYSYSGEAPVITSLPAVERDYYTFSGWTYNGSLLSESNPIIVVQDTTTPYTVTANWTPITYTIKYKAYLNNSLTEFEDVYTNENATSLTIESGKIALKSAVATGYTFDGWYIVNTITNEEISIPVGTEIYVGAAYGGFTFGQDITELELVCYFKEMFTVTYIIPNYDNVNTSVIAGSYAQELDLNSYNNKDSDEYIYEGWYTDETYSQKYDFVNTAITSPLTLYAKAIAGQKTQITLTIDPNGGTLINGDTTSTNAITVSKFVQSNVKGNFSLISYSATRDGYVFAGYWNTSSDGSGDNYTNTISLSSSATIYPVFIPLRTITISNTGTTTSINVVSCVCGQHSGTHTTDTVLCEGDTFKVTSFSAASGYYNASFTINEKVGAVNTIYTVTGDTTIKGTATAYLTVTLSGTNSNNIKYVVYRGSTKLSNNFKPGDKLIVYTDDTDGLKFTITGTTADASDVEIKSNSTGEANGKTYYFNTNVTISSSGSCIVEGTLITLADGSQKKIEDLTHNDRILVFNHETGKLDVSTMMFNAHTEQGAEKVTVTNMYFSNGAILRIVSEHGFFDIDANKYVYITEENIESYLGHKFYSTNYVEGKFVSEIVTLNRYELTEETVRYYSPMSASAINLFTEGVLSSTAEYDELINVFELDENMMIDQAKKQADIDKYGLCDYETSIWKDYVSYEVFLAFNGQYVNVAIGKGLVTQEYVIYLIETYDIGNTVILPNETTTTQ
ncbi:MAG: InlB B-repeat-containing protein, partial [Clostridia bacterium]|nr:InlB B-repeat-containing protein [Clostridia bacterium]